ncbi:MAG: hypothetical protein JXA00_02890 [Candidatus Thermoplasmatota archaeon]|nr:hypothetical protein [Candidatus Thermoplasmatota archaeon]
MRQGKASSQLQAALVICVVLGVSFVPMVTAHDQQPIDDQTQCVDVSIEVCGMQETEKHTVSLREDDALRLKAMTQSLKERLDAAATEEEFAQICSEMVRALESFGVLPPGQSVESVLRLVTRGLRADQRAVLGKNRCIDTEVGDLKNINALCLVAGATDTTLIIPYLAGLHYLSYLSVFGILKLIVSVLEILSPILYKLIVSLIYALPLTLFVFYVEHIFTPIQKYLLYKPFIFGNFIVLGYQNPMPPNTWPASGWLATAGALGIKGWNGSFTGGFDLGRGFNVGIIGFTGIKLGWGYEYLWSEELFYFGSALVVKID